MIVSEPPALWKGCEPEKDLWRLMAHDETYVAVLRFLLAGIFVALAAWTALSQRRKARQGDLRAEEVRRQMLAFREALYREACSPGAADQVTGVFIETGRELTTKFLAASPDGAVRRFYSDGESMVLSPTVGDARLRSTFEPVFASAKALIAAAEPFLGELSAEEIHPLPAPGKVRLVILSSRGAYVSEESETSLENRTSRFWPIHQAARDLEAAISRAQDERTEYLTSLR